MSVGEQIKNTVISEQPTRIILKSIRNIFFPAKLNAGMIKTITIEVSSICDAKCVFCNYRFGHREKRIMALEDFKKVTYSAVELGYENLDLTSMGGELFVHKEAVEIVKVAKHAGFKHIGVFTNAILINRHNVDELLKSGIDVLLISFPGFSDRLYEEIFQVNKFAEFRKSLTILFETHKRLNSDVIIVLEPRTYLTKEQIERSDFYKEFVSQFVGKKIVIKEPLRVYDTWGGEIRRRDLMDGMRLDVNPVKSLYPLKRPHLCCRILMVGILANGDVRLCNCRYDSTIETEMDALYLDNLNDYRDFRELYLANQDKIEKIHSDFRNGKMPALCRKCPFYEPVRL